MGKPVSLLREIGVSNRRAETFMGEVAKQHRGARRGAGMEGARAGPSVL